jgi:transposase
VGREELSGSAKQQKGITKLVKLLWERKPCLIVVEATGGYEEAVVLALFEAAGLLCL